MLKAEKNTNISNKKYILSIPSPGLVPGTVGNTKKKHSSWLLRDYNQWKVK